MGQDDDSVAQAVDEINEKHAMPPDAEGQPVITFSHFLPRVELLPEKRYLFTPSLAKAVGSRFLWERVRELAPSVHVFGHTHFGWDADLDGIRYVQAALGYPQEWASRQSSM